MSYCLTNGLVHVWVYAFTLVVAFSAFECMYPYIHVFKQLLSMEVKLMHRVKEREWVGSER